MDYDRLLKAEKEKYDQLLNDYNKYVQDSEEKVGNLELQLSKCEQYVVSYEQEIQTLKYTRDGVLCEKERALYDLEQLKIELLDKNSNIEHLEIQLSELNSTIDKLTYNTQNNVINQSVQGASNMNNKVDNDGNERLNTDIFNLTNENERLQIELNFLVSTYQNEIETYKNDIMKITGEYGQLEIKYNTLLHDYDQYKTNINETFITADREKKQLIELIDQMKNNKTMNINSVQSDMIISNDNSKSTDQHDSNDNINNLNSNTNNNIDNYRKLTSTLTLITSHLIMPDLVKLNSPKPWLFSNTLHSPYIQLSNNDRKCSCDIKGRNWIFLTHNLTSNSIVSIDFKISNPKVDINSISIGVVAPPQNLMISSKLYLYNLQGGNFFNSDKFIDDYYIIGNIIRLTIDMKESKLYVINDKRLLGFFNDLPPLVIPCIFTSQCNFFSMEIIDVNIHNLN